MKGQWIGKNSGTNEGGIVLNIDERSDKYEGIAYLFPNDNKLPSAGIFFKTFNKDKTFKLKIDYVLPVNPKTYLLDTWANVKNFYDGSTIFPEQVEIEVTWTGNILALEWKTNISTHGLGILEISRASQPSDLVAKKIDLKEFRNSFSNIANRHYIFRGQNRPWRLRTAFHRAGRFILDRFINEDVAMLHKHLSASTKHVFNLENPKENGAFFNLLQHHGYPTPLLDWTYSPYVAAFFAYRGITSSDAEKSNPEDKVRIYAFDLQRWKENHPQINILNTAALHLSVGEFMAIENERTIPQQAISLVTNIDDIETYITSHQTNGNTYLFAFDLPVSARNEMIRELKFMGITGGSLFPGLDGACEELKERNFRI